MATFATLPIAADRAGPCVRSCSARARSERDCAGDGTAAGPDTPGAPLLALGMGGNAQAEGLYLVDMTTGDDGVPVSQVQIRINETTMENATKVPYSGELGDPSILAYGLIGIFSGDKRTLAQGEFVALPTVYGANNAPSNRAPGYSLSGNRYQTWTAKALTFGDDGIFISDRRRRSARPAGQNRYRRGWRRHRGREYRRQVTSASSTTQLAAARAQVGAVVGNGAPIVVPYAPNPRAQAWADACAAAGSPVSIARVRGMSRFWDVLDARGTSAKIRSCGWMGDTAAQSRINLASPGVNDLTFNGNVTFTAGPTGGFGGGGVAGINIDTHIPLNSLNPATATIGFFSQGGSSTDNYDMGVIDATSSLAICSSYQGGGAAALPVVRTIDIADR